MPTSCHPAVSASGSGTPAGRTGSSVHGAESLTIAQYDLAGAGKSQHAFAVKLRKGPRYGFQRKTQIVADIPAAHRQRHHACDGKATVHLKKEVCYPLHGALAPEKQHMIFRMPKIAGGHRPKFLRNLDIGPRRLLETAAFHQAHGSIDNGFRRQPVADSRFQSEDVVRQMKCSNLTPSIGKQFVGPNGPLDYLIDVFRRLVLSVDFFIFPVGELRGNEAGMTREQAELIGVSGR